LDKKKERDMSVDEYSPMEIRGQQEEVKNEEPN
jgi:hypothetical protein